MMGVPGSGKTTLACKMAEAIGAVVHSYDEVKDLQIWMQGITKDVLSGKTVIADDTNLNREMRERFLCGIRDVPGKRVLVWLDTPLEECLKRNAGRENKVPKEEIWLSNRLMEPPSPKEGWDKIHIYRW